MLERLSVHIQACYKRAARAESSAAKAGVAEKSRYLAMARSWTHLAHSYEFAQGFERFLIESDSNGAPASDAANIRAAWQGAATAPYDRDLRLAVFDEDGVAHALVFPCRRILGGWIKSETRERVQIDPSHWQEWTDDALGDRISP